MNKAIVINEHIYGLYSETTKLFTCTHGGWVSEIKLLDNNMCLVKEIPSKHPVSYRFIDKIPEEHNHVNQKHSS